MPRLILSSVRGARSAQYLMVSHVAGVSGYSSPKVKGPFGSQQCSACKFEATDSGIAVTIGKRREVNRLRPLINTHTLIYVGGSTAAKEDKEHNVVERPI